MIKLVYGHDREKFPELIDAMHRLRKQVFHDRLRWEVPISGDWEIDAFDEEDPLYVLSLDSKGMLQGSLRLLPTTGPNMLRDVFSDLTKETGPVSRIPKSGKAAGSASDFQVSGTSAKAT